MTFWVHPVAAQGHIGRPKQLSRHHLDLLGALLEIPWSHGHVHGHGHAMTMAIAMAMPGHIMAMPLPCHGHAMAMPWPCNGDAMTVAMAMFMAMAYSTGRAIAQLACTRPPPSSPAVVEVHGAKHGIWNRQKLAPEKGSPNPDAHHRPKGRRVHDSLANNHSAQSRPEHLRPLKRQFQASRLTTNGVANNILQPTLWVTARSGRNQAHSTIETQNVLTTALWPGQPPNNKTHRPHRTNCTSVAT